jgi:hypothetical protein
MGCGSSAPAAASIPDSGAAPVDLEITEFTSVIDSQISGLFKKGMKATPTTDGAYFKHVAAAGDKGKIIVAALPKVEAPEMPGLGTQMKMAAGAPVNMQIKSTMHTIFKPASGAIETTLVYAPLTCNYSLGFGFGKVAVDDGVTGTVTSYMAQGWQLAGLNLAGSATNTDFGSGTSTSLAELVFQKMQAAPQKEVSFVQTGINVKVSMGKMSSTLPDFMQYLSKQGAEGWELAGMLMPPAPPPQAGAMSFSYDMPVIIAMSRTQGSTAPIKFHEATYDYQMKAGVTGVDIKGDIVPLIKEAAAKGWEIRSALSVPPEQSGMASFKLKVKCFFQC